VAITLTNAQRHQCHLMGTLRQQGSQSRHDTFGSSSIERMDNAGDFQICGFRLWLW
jgi:hypothetical protein